jgi:hypothetical protein
VKHGVRLGEDQHARQACFRKLMKDLLDDGRAGSTERCPEHRHHFVRRAICEVGASAEVNGEQGG